MSDRRAVVHIFSSYNNVLMTATDLTGAETITTCSGGRSSRPPPTAAASSRPPVPQSASPMPCVRRIHATHHQVPRAWRQQGKHDRTRCGAAIRALTRAGMTITRIEDVTPIAHDGTKKKGGRRGRRV